MVVVHAHHRSYEVRPTLYQLLQDCGKKVRCALIGLLPVAAEQVCNPNVIVEIRLVKIINDDGCHHGLAGSRYSRTK
jgi:hypothetical protein